MKLEHSTTDAVRRVIFYLLYDDRGHVDDYIPYKLERLRPFASHIVVIVNGALSADGRETVGAVADEVWERPNTGYDVAAYKDALARFGRDRFEEFDELILMNYTWFGPIRPFAPLFDRMSSADLDFWGLTDHGAVTPNPLTLEGTMPAHIQSHWIAVRRSMFLSEDWDSYWRDMPPITSYSDSVLLHESRFTDHFQRLGYASGTAYPHAEYPSTSHPAFDNAQALIDDGCPALKRRPFFHDPLYLDRHAIIGRWLVDSATATGYPEDLIWQSMAKSTDPRVLYTNGALMRVVPEQASEYDETAPLSIVAVVHIYYEDMTGELLDSLATLPPGFNLVVTTATEEKAEHIREVVGSRQDVGFTSFEVRVVGSNRGRDQSAFYITARDILRSEQYDIVVKIHSKRSAQDGAGVGSFFKRQQLENLLRSPLYTRNVLALFQRRKSLGIVFPPMIHIGYPTMGNAWFTNRPATDALKERMGIRVPSTVASPLAPYGGMFIARIAALRLMVDEEWTFDEYAAENDYADGTLSHVQERIVPLAVAELGFHSETVSNAEYAGISHTLLEYKLDRFSAPFGSGAMDGIRLAAQSAEVAKDLLPVGRLEYAKNYVIRYHPASLGRLTRIYRPLRGLSRRLRGVRRRPPAGTPG